MYNGDSSLSTNQKVCWSSNLLLSLENKNHEAIYIYVYSIGDSSLTINQKVYWSSNLPFSNKFIIEMYRTST